LVGEPQGVTAGGRVGYDFQAGSVVWGIESDLSWSDFKRSGNEILYGGLGGVAWNETTDWWGSTNLRLGVPFLSNQALVYGLGGVAYGNRTMDASGFVGPFSTTGSFGGTSVGWDVGGGLAAKIGSSGEVFVEGRWVDLGSVAGQLTLTIPGEIFVAGASQKFDFAIGEVGYAYHF
jgi:outer membrane immunogenic protein